MITRSTLRSQIATALRDEVLAGRLPAGRPVTVKEIAEQYGVSATPVREALLDLAAQGLLDVEQHRGFRVHQFTVEDFRRMIEARVLILEGVFRRAVAAVGPAVAAPSDLGLGPGGSGGGMGWCDVPPDVLRSIRRRAEAAQRAALAGDLDVLIGYDLRFWRELGALIGNSCISDFLDQLRIQCWAFSVPHLRQEHDLAGRLWARHCELADAVERCDPATAERIVAAHNDHWLALVEKLVG